MRSTLILLVIALLAFTSFTFAHSDDALAELSSHIADEANAALDEQAFYENELTQDELNLLESDADADTDAELDSALDTAADSTAHTDAEAEAEADSEVDTEAEAQAEADSEDQLGNDGNVWMETGASADDEPLSASDRLDHILMQVGEDEEEAAAEGEKKPENPTYVLPYPPVLPGFYTPLFNPYTNVNPLSTPFANYAAQPGAHPGVAAAAAANAGALAAAHASAANYAGYPFAHSRAAAFGGAFAPANPLLAANLAGYPVAAHHPYGWIHPQNLNSAAVGENEKEEFPQFVELDSEAAVEDEEAAAVGCINCAFNN